MLEGGLPSIKKSAKRKQKTSKGQATKAGVGAWGDRGTMFLTGKEELLHTGQHRLRGK